MARIFIDGFENGSLNNWDVGSVGTASNEVIGGFKGVYSASLAGSTGTLIKTFSTSYNELIIGKVVSPQDSVDIVLDFNEVAYGEIENITINTPSEYPD